MREDAPVPILMTAGADDSGRKLNNAVHHDPRSLCIEAGLATRTQAHAPETSATVPRPKYRQPFRATAQNAKDSIRRALRDSAMYSDCTGHVG